MKTSTKQTLKIYWQHARQYSGSLLVLLVTLIGFNSIEIYIPFWYKSFFNTLATGNTSAVKPLISIITAILILNFISWIFRRVGHLRINFFEPRVMSDLVNTCYEYLHKHSINFFNNNFVGSLVRRVNRFARSFEQIADLVYFEIGKTILFIISILVVLFILYWQLGVLILVWSILYSLVNFWFARYKLRYDIQRSLLDTKTTGHLADTITNNFNLKLFGSLDFEFDIYRELTDKLFKLRKFTWDIREYADALQVAWMILLEFGVFYIAIRFWQRGLITIGDFALLQAYVLQIFNHLWGLGRHIQKFYEALAEAEEMTKILAKPHMVKDIPKADKLHVTAGQIDFSNVRFAYPGQNVVFEKFNLKIKAGEKVALIGPSGGGKSTFVKLLLRFFDINSGKILIDGQNIAQVTQDSLRSNIGLVPQDPILFHRDLMENIRYGKRSATDEEVIEAAKLAHCHEFIIQFPQGYGTYVGERGVKLSGGQRQRVAIARAMLANAPILVLDEATSSLDSESEYYIQDALKKLIQDKTNIVIAHRLSTIMKMDRIIVLENGRITEEGTHAELLKVRKGTYQKLWEIQAGGFIT